MMEVEGVGYVLKCDVEGCTEFLRTLRKNKWAYAVMEFDSVDEAEKQGWYVATTFPVIGRYVACPKHHPVKRESE